uniref:Cadherin domain-containing protein n=1 Tax=Periophthalmus magnuspinnatus TaxID=409849 RepID=A0A3B4B0Z4_9GOBI
MLSIAVSIVENALINILVFLNFIYDLFCIIYLIHKAGYTLTVSASDQGSPPLTSTVSVEITILDINDHSPQFQSPSYTADISEDVPIGSLVVDVKAVDLDQGVNSQIVYFLSQGSKSMFIIDQNTGRIITAAPLDREKVASYSFDVYAIDSSPANPRNSTAQVTVYIQDPKNADSTSHGPGQSSAVFARSGGCLLQRAGVHGDKVLKECEGCQSARERSSRLATLNLTHLNANLTVLVEDVNDNRPVFTQELYQVQTDNLPGSTILTLEAIDGDLSRDNCGFDFAITSGNSGNTFQIESSVRFLEGKGFQTVGSIILVEELDFEAIPKYNLTVVVSDRGIPQQSSSVPILISITDANDNPPAFSRAEYNIILSEGVATGTEILHLSASDPDSAPNGEVQYSISSGNENELFQVDMWTGVLKLRKTLSGESQSSHVIVVQATDGQGHYAFVPVTIEVKDINDNRPYFPLKQVTASIRENQPKNALVTILHAIDHDRGLYGQLKYFMFDNSKDGKNAFLINQTTGEIRTRSSFDYEKVNSFNFVVGAMDTGNYSATVTVQVYVTGMDEYDPVFTSSEFLFEVPDGAKKGQVIGRVQAKDEDGGVDGIVLYSMLDPSPYFEMNKSNGEISLKMDSYSRPVSRSKRELRQMTLKVTAHSPLETSRVAVAKVRVDVTHTTFGIHTDMNTALLSVIAVSLGTIVILILIALALFFVKLRCQRKYHKGHGRKLGSSTMMHKFEETKFENHVTKHSKISRIF